MILGVPISLKRTEYFFPEQLSWWREVEGELTGVNTKRVDLQIRSCLGSDKSHGIWSHRWTRCDVVTFWNRIPIASCYQKLGCGMREVITSTSKWVCLLGNMTRLKVGSLDPSYHTFSMSSRDTMGCPSAWSSMCRGAGQRYCRKSLVAQLWCLLSQGHWQLKLSRNSLDADEH